MKNAVVLWTGGKDSCLALHRVLEQGTSVRALVTFVPKNGQSFQAHPIDEMKYQAKRMNLPIHFIPIEEPFRESYVESLKWIKQELKVESVVTGDIDTVAGFPNWITECSKNLDLEVIMPLWHQNRIDLMDELWRRKIRVKISWINNKVIPAKWIGKTMDSFLFHELRELSNAHKFDLCGENGEYHTMVEWCPLFIQ